MRNDGVLGSEPVVNHRRITSPDGENWPLIEVREAIDEFSGPHERLISVDNDDYALTAAGARQLAAALHEAADLLDELGGSYSRDPVHQHVSVGGS